MPGLRYRSTAPAGMDLDGGHAVRHDDVVIPALTAGSGTAAMTFERLRDTEWWTYFFRHDQDDRLTLGFQMPHRKLLGSVIDSLHLHLMPCVAPAAAQDVIFRVTYAWVNIGGTVPAAVSWTAPADTTLTINPGDVYKHMDHNICTNMAIPAGGDTYSSIFLALVTRMSSLVTDTYTTAKTEAVPPNTAAANLALLSADLHISVDRFGSVLVASDV